MIVFSELAQSFTEEIMERVHTYFEQIYNQPPDPTLSIAEVISMLKSFQRSRDQENRDILAYMLYLLLEEFKSFPLYSDRELQIAAQLLGEVIDNSIVTHGALGIALQFILESLEHEPDSSMYQFGVTALRCFKTKIKEYPQFCQQMSQIPHFMQLPRNLLEMNPLANIKNFVPPGFGPVGSHRAKNQSQTMANQALAPSGSSSKTHESIVQQLKLQQQMKQGQEQLKQHQEQLKLRSQHMQFLRTLESILTDQGCLTKSDGRLKKQREQQMQLKQEQQMQLKQQEELQMQLRQREEQLIQVQQEQMQEQLQQLVKAAVSENPEYYIQKTFSQEVQEKANSILGLIFSQPPAPTMAISKALHILKCLKLSPNEIYKNIPGCVVSKLLQQFKFLHNYNARDLQLMAQLYGGIIECDIAIYWDHRVTLRYILDSLRLTPNYTMFHFGVLALDRFKHKLKNLAVFCQHLMRIPHIQLSPQLLEYVQYGAGQCPQCPDPVCQRGML